MLARSWQARARPCGAGGIPISTLFTKSSLLLIRAGVLSLLSVALMVLDHHGHAPFIRSSLSTLVYPLQAAVVLPVNAAQWVFRNMATREQLIEEVAQLKEQKLLLQSRLQRFAALDGENRRLRELMEASHRARDRMLLAEVMAVEMQGQHHKFTINKGERSGAYVGQPITDATGLMGQIERVGAFSSLVRLITDPRHALPVQVNRNGLRAIAVGTGAAERLQLEHLPVNADVRVGDLLVSSGLGQRFPRGYPVGVINELVRSEGAAFLHAKVEPSARLGKSREVLMIWPTNHVPGPEVGAH